MQSNTLCCSTLISKRVFKTGTKGAVRVKLSREELHLQDTGS